MSKDVNLPLISAFSIATIFTVSFFQNISGPVLELPNKFMVFGMFVPVALMLLSCLAYFRKANKFGILFGFLGGALLFLISFIVRAKLEITYGQLLFSGLCLLALGVIGVLEGFEESSEEQSDEFEFAKDPHPAPENRLIEQKAASLRETIEQNGKTADTIFPVLRARFSGISDKYNDEKLIQLIRQNYEHFFQDKSDEELIELVERHLSRKEQAVP